MPRGAEVIRVAKDIGGKLSFHDCTLLLTRRGAHRILSDAWHKLWPPGHRWPSLPNGLNPKDCRPAFHGRFLRLEDFLLQSCATLRSALQMVSDRNAQCQQRCATLQKQAQKLFLELQISRSEPTELCRPSHTKAVFSELIKSSPRPASRVPSMINS